MKKVVLFFIFIFSTILFFSCKGHDSKDTIAKLMQYNNAYVGDASTIGNILSLLEVNRDSIKLTTSQKPYGIQVYCVETESPVNEELLKKTNLYNSAIIFSLVQNVDEIRFNYVNGLEYSFKRNELSCFFWTSIGNIWAR